MPKEDLSLTRHEKTTLCLVIFVIVAGFLGIDIHLASLPFIMRSLHTTRAVMQQSVSLYALGMGTSLLVYGPLSDAYGRKPILIFGLSLATVACLSTAYAHAVPFFLAMRIVQGIGAGACLGLSRTIITDTLNGVKLSAVGSYLGIFVSLSPMFAPTLGGYIQHWFGWRANFIILGIILLCVLILVIRICPETNTQKNPHAFKLKVLLPNYKSLLKNTCFMAFSLTSGLGVSAGLAYAAISSFIFQTELHLSPVAYGQLAIIIGIAAILGKLVNGYIVQRLGILKSLTLSLFVIGLSGIILLIGNMFHIVSVSFVIGCVALTSVASAVTAPNSTAGGFTHITHSRGTANALYGSTQMIVGFIVSSLAGLFVHDGIVVLAGAYILIGLCGVSTYRLRKIKG